MRGDEDNPNSELIARRREHDRDDFHNEHAGRDVGRIQRFLPEDARPDHSGKRAEREYKRVSALLSLLQSDPAYAALHGDTLDRLREAEAAAALALSQATSALDQARTDLADALEGGSMLGDGTRVFRDQNGNVWTEDGERVEGDALDEIVWREGGVAREEFLARKKAVDEGQRTVEAILQYQVEVLGHARNRLMDEDDPPSKEELEEIQDRIRDASPFTNKNVPDDPGSVPNKGLSGSVHVKLPPVGG